MKNGVFSFLSIIFCAFSAVLAADIAEWDGTADTDWYNDDETAFTITTAEQLAGLAKLVNDGNNFKDKTIALDADIILNDTTDWKLWNEDTENLKMWVPIGGILSFAGSFDGEDHKISGLYINSTEDDQGLFGRASSASIKNVGVLASFVKGGSYVGGIAGFNGWGSIANCHFVGSVSGLDRVGGLAGLNNTVQNSYFVGVVNGTGSYAGGLVGYGEQAWITDSYSIGAINGADHVGGIIGIVYTGRVLDSYFTGEVSGVNFVGGIAGRNDGTIYRVYSIAEVNGAGAIGGIVGSNRYDGSVLNSYSLGDITGNNSVGGIAGINSFLGSGRIVNNYSKGTVMGANEVGGVIGINYDGLVINNYSVGNVSGTSKVGGIIGTIYGGGTIANNYSSGVIEGIDSVGGIAGNNYRGKVFNSYWNKTLNSEINGVAEGAVGEDNVANIAGMADTEMKSAQFVETLNAFADSANAAQAGIVYFSWFPDANDFNQGYPTFAYGLADVTVTLAENSYIYDGNAKIPAVAVKLGNATLIENTDYTVSYINNTDVGNATINITGINGYTGIKTATFTITKKVPTVADLDFAIPANHVYNGSEQGIGTIAIKSPMVGIGDITIKYNGSTVAPINAGTYTVTIDIAEGTNFAAATEISLGTYNIDSEETDIIQKPILTSNINILISAKYLQIQGIAKTEKVLLSNLKGSILLNRTVQPNENISIAHLPQGIYLLNVGSETFKFAK